MTHQTIAEFVSYLQALDVQVFIEGDRASGTATRLRCTAPEGTLTLSLRQALADRKAELITYLSDDEAEGRLRRERSAERRQEAGFDVSAQPNVGRRQEVDGRKQTAEDREKDREPSALPIYRLISPSHPIHPSTSSLPSPLSFAQQRLWFLDQLTPGNPFYNVPAAIRLIGTLDRTALERSFQEIVRRHAALRTTFITVDGQPVQVVEATANITLAVVNLQTVAVSERERISQQLATAEAQHPFNLTSDPLLRVTLLQFDAMEAVLLLTMHHIVADGWSLGVLIRELACCYTAFVEGRSPNLLPLPIQYTDFSHWQRHQLQGEVLETQLAYWRKQLHQLPVLQLPRDRPRPAVQTYRGATYPLQLTPTLTQALEALSQECGTSLFMTLVAAFQTLLYRYTGQEDVAIGSPIANRHRSEWEGLIGFFVNSLVLRTDLSGRPTFRELLERVRNVALEAYQYQDLPFEKLVEELDPDRDLSRNPLFQVAFALQNAPMQSLELPGLTLEPAPLESSSTRFDLEVHLWEPAHGLKSLWRSQEGLSGFVAYSTDLFDRDRIGRLVGHFQTVLEGIVANPDAVLSDLPLLTATEEQQLVVAWNQIHRTDTDLADIDLADIDLADTDLANTDLANTDLDDRCFHHIFEAQVDATPEAIALVSEHDSLTYRALNEQANRLAQTLQQMGIQPNTLVGLCVDRSAAMVIGILGILKAGGAYVPLDPHYPADRLHFMLTDTQVSLLLTQSWLVKQLPRSSATILCLDQPLPVPMEPPTDVPLTANHLAYVIYTSGSTGTPKGVLLSHRGLCNVVEAQQRVFHLSRRSRILQFSSLSFDASVFELALAFGSGGTLYVPPKSAQLPGSALVQFLDDNAITHAILTPAVLAVLPQAALPALQVLITGGEACSRQVVDRWAVNRHFFNAYGPTETTIWATVAALHPGDNPLTIGRPILNTQVYLLDAHQKPVPIGIPGELYIGGIGLAQGYLNRPTLTAERFLPNPFPPNPFPPNPFLLQPSLPNPSLLHPFVPNSSLPAPLGQQAMEHSTSHPPCPTAVMYRTGDRALLRPDGCIEFLGRVDRQIKIRGFRIELGEIEATLQRHPAIRETVVIATEEPSSERRLLAYFSLDLQFLQQQALQQFLQTQHIQHWQTLYNQTYQLLTSHSPLPTPHFNITGWNSSYTGQPIPREHMQEWVSDRVQQILALKPKRVLEIGCGTGLLLFPLAPHCETYVGTDFSTDALALIQQQLQPLKLTHVELLHRMATDFEGIETAAFDVVLLNSIVQYFPSEDYLMQVLEKAMQAVAPGGALFIGDVRSLPLLDAFHTWVQFCRADAGMERAQLQQLVQHARFEEPELAIAPAFFSALRDRFPHIQQVQISLSRGCSHNEMTQFRYNVWLQVEPSDAAASPESQSGSGAHAMGDRTLLEHDWQRQPVTVAWMQQQLEEAQPEWLLITNVSNSRVIAAMQTAQWLTHQDNPKTVGRMREVLQDQDAVAIDPQRWWDLETVLPYTVTITWSTETHTGNYDVLLRRHGIAAVDGSFAPSASPAAPPYTNHPLQAIVARQLIPELREFLQQTVPDYMVPSAFVPLSALPLTTNGKVDRRALPTLSETTIHSSHATSVPSTPTEATLIDIWQELLRLKSVNVHDNFFELGGHSLLATQMTSRVRDAFGLELPLQSVFETPTIAQLAALLETLRASPATPKVPPLIRLDRAAYRRPRSPLAGKELPFQDLSLHDRPPHDLPLQDLPLHDRPPHDRSLATVPSGNKPIPVADPSNTARSPLVPLTLGGTKPPFFCVHPLFGVVFPYLELAQQLNGDRSFYGLQPLGLDGTTPLNRIEAIATYYIQAIQTLQPHGPYFLGGWSFGGLVAFEMAQQLTQAGQRVALLALLDTTAPCHQQSWGQSLKFLLGTALWSTLPFLLDYGAIAANRLRASTLLSRWQWSSIIRHLPEETRLPLLDEATIAPLLPIVYANVQATYRYVPQPYSDRITLFTAIEPVDANGQDPTLGWSYLASDIQRHPVPGNHLSLLKQPHVQTLAQQLQPYLS